MGNRAVITTPEKKFGIYLHWNGGAESVLAFLAVARARGFRDPVQDTAYGMARLCGLICEFFGQGDTSVGIGMLAELDTDNGGNGVYVAGAGWNVVERYGSGSNPVMDINGLNEDGRKKYDAIVAQLSTS